MTSLADQLLKGRRDRSPLPLLLPSAVQRRLPPSYKVGKQGGEDPIETVRTQKMCPEVLLGAYLQVCV